MQPYRNLRVWTAAHQLALDVYRLTAHFPDEERYGVTSQLRRAAVSIAANIVEGTHRRTAVDFARFLNNAEASAAECDYLLLLCGELGYLDSSVSADSSKSVRRLSQSLQVLRQAVLRGPNRTPSTEN